MMSTSSWTFLVVAHFLALSASTTVARGFLLSPPSSPSTSVGNKIQKLTSAIFSTAVVNTEDTTTADNDALSSSWSNLEEALAAETDEEEPEPLLTLYRDTNGWCPFCERVWVALRAKNIPYRESLISLFDKPQWYNDLVPTTLVPAVLFHGDTKTTTDDDSQEDKKNERRLVWESMDILKALDEEFPDDGPQLVHQDDPSFVAALQAAEDLNMAGFRYQYASRNSSLTTEQVQDYRLEFEKQLNQLDAALAENNNKNSPFAWGSTFSAVDACLLPSLERWRYQLPLTLEFNIMDGRPGLEAWMDYLQTDYPPYAHRVAGDEYSWTAVASTFLRYFSTNETAPQVADAIERADTAAQALTGSFAEQSIQDGGFALEAARKLITNHEAVVKDCTNPEPKSQTNLPRASNVDAADAVLRHVASLLLPSSTNDSSSLIERTKTAPLPLDENQKEGALAARTVASRLCVPRDMSGPAAGTLRTVLAITANRLDEATSP